MNTNVHAIAEIDDAAIDDAIQLAVQADARVYQKLVDLIKPSGKLRIELQLPRPVEEKVAGRGGSFIRKYTFVVLNLRWIAPCLSGDSARSQVQSSAQLGLVKNDGERWVPGSSSLGFRFELDELICMFPSASAFLLSLSKSKAQFCDS